MKILLLSGCVLGGAGSSCATSPSPVREPLPELTSEAASAPRAAGNDRVVALFNGDPLSWQTVAEKALELDLKEAVDRYVRWRVIEDRKAALGVANTKEELLKRAQAHAARLKHLLGESAFRKELEKEGATEATYVARLADSALMAQMLTLDKIVRYDALLEERVEIDRLYFVEPSEARRFVESARIRGFDAAAEAIGGEDRRKTSGRLPRETFARGAPPADPPLDAAILERVLALKPGDFTEAEASRSNLTYVIRFKAVHPARKGSFAALKGEILEGIWADPPVPQDYARWVERALARCRVDYRAGGKS